MKVRTVTIFQWIITTHMIRCNVHFYGFDLFGLFVTAVYVTFNDISVTYVMAHIDFGVYIHPLKIITNISWNITHKLNIDTYKTQFELEWGCPNETKYPPRQPIQTPQVMCTKPFYLTACTSTDGQTERLQWI